MLNITGYMICTPIHISRARSIYAAVRVSDGLPVVIKSSSDEYPSRQSMAELRREFNVIQKLQDVENVIRAYALESDDHGNVAIVLEQFGHSLAQEIKQCGQQLFPLERFFKIAISLAEILAGVHELDVVHKNIEPHSILINDSDAVKLIDFSISSEISLERQHVSKKIEGKLPYISPEQTGRMNRELDYRSDYYSLGITLFELLTGRLPFEADSDLGWIHSHISMPARSPKEIDQSIPEPVAEIILKLLAKNTEDRYQSSYGLVADLSRCQREFAQTGTVAPFSLGRRDVSRRFQIPQKLYGREPELAVLTALFEQVAAGTTEICMVSGHSGIGKSALVNEINKLLVRQNGYLIQGKFDQFRRNTPYSALAAALRSLVQQLLAESDERRNNLREKLLTAMGPNGQLLIDLVPDFELIIGPQPPVPELPRTEAQNRFHITFLNVIRVITKEHPLVIFLDDLQFGGAPTLNLIQVLATARELTHLLVIGAYRSNEVDAGHPLRQALNELQQSRSIHELPLRPLDLGSVEKLVADTLICDPATSKELSELLYERAQGNPFFLTEMLTSLEKERAIVFASDVGRWRWDMGAIRRIVFGGDVLQLMAKKLRDLPTPTQQGLQLAACIGNTFDLRTLSIICERPMDEVGENLLPALQKHMIVPMHGDYKLVGNAGGADSRVGLNPIYRFQHDRVQQAAYALIDSEHKQSVHLSVGRLILRHADAAEQDLRLVEIVSHLNEGRRLVDDPAERKEIARLNLAAGIRSQRSSAYEAALGYLRIGQELLPTDSWAQDYDLTMALALEIQQCAYLTARYDEAELWIEHMLAHARSNLEKAEILSMRTRQYATTGKMEASIQSAIMGLSLLGIRITDNPDQAAIRREKAMVARNLAGRKIADLIAAPQLSDPAKMISIRLLMEIFPAAFLSGSGNLFPFLVLKSVNISLSSGNSPESAFAFAAYGMLLCGALQEPGLGYEFGKLAVAMNDQLDDIALKSRVIYVYAMFIHHWSNHWSSMTPWFRKGIESGYQSGDLLYLAYSAQDCIIWDPKLDLDAAAEQHAELLNIVRDCAYQDSLDSGTLFLQMQRNFLGLTEGLCSMNDASFDEQRCVDGMRKRKFMTGIANYHIYKAEIFFFYGHYSEALACVRAQDELVASVMSLPQLVRFNIIAFLTLAACFPDMDGAEKDQARKRMNADLTRMARWATHCPVNFLHLQFLMQAELARLAGRVEAALQMYEQAIDAAHAAEFRRDEAMANELAARHLLAAGRRKAAEGYLSEALHLYERWGARRKVEHLQEEFAQMLGPQLLRLREPHSVTSTEIQSGALDLASVMKASQAISSEIEFNRLWTTTMRVMLENAGGQRGCFVIRNDRRLTIEGLSEINAGLERPIPFDGAEGALAVPMSIVYQVLNTNSPIVIDDATRAWHFAKDPYVLARKPRSVLCIPLVRQGKFDGVIYMENFLVAGVFSEERIEVIRLLAAQVAISMENAKLYLDQKRLIEAQRHFVPDQFLESLHHYDIARVEPGEHVAVTMSMMFADLRNFTLLAEQLDPPTVIELLNRYFVTMEPQISEAGGFIDSFSGDEIKALFRTSADAPVRAGISMWRALDEFNRRSAILGQPELHIGIGVNTGPMVLGVVGGRNRFQCSVVGDTANLASRIEQLTKTYRARFLISEHTFRSLPEPNDFETRMIDRVAVMGKNAAVELYEILDADSLERRAAKIATRNALCSAMDRYFAREFGAALTIFEQICAADPDDPVPLLFVERCSRYLKEPPPHDWQGFEKLTHK